jgi:hypothetical protein
MTQFTIALPLFDLAAYEAQLAAEAEAAAHPVAIATEEGPDDDSISPPAADEKAAGEEDPPAA